MNAGKRRHRVTIEKKTETAGTYGEPLEVWTSIGRRWANIVPLSSHQLVEAQKIESRVSDTISMRYHATISTQHRITFGTRLFSIESARNPDERGRETVLRCWEIIA